MTKIETQLIIELQDINDNLKQIAKSLTELNLRDMKQKGATK